jgi:hypothetical protein
MSVGIGTVAAQILFWEYLFRISVLCLCSAEVSEQQNNTINRATKLEEFSSKRLLLLFFNMKKYLTYIGYSITVKYWISKVYSQLHTCFHWKTKLPANFVVSNSAEPTNR